MINLEMINTIKEWGFNIEKEYNPTKYLLNYEEATELISFSDYLGDEFENYLREYDIQIFDYELSDIGEFFEKYGIEIY